MTNNIFKYSFPESIPAQQLEGTTRLAMLAVESQYGRTRAREECRFYLDRRNRTCVIDASTDAGYDLKRIFTVFAVEKYGAHSVKIERIQPDSTHTMEGVRHD